MNPFRPQSPRVEDDPMQRAISLYEAGVFGNPGTQEAIDSFARHVRRAAGLKEHHEAIAWPRAPLIRVSGRLRRQGKVPGRMYRYVGRECNSLGLKDAFIYAALPVWPIYAIAHWWKYGYVERLMCAPRWCLEILLLNIGVLTMHEADYLHRWRVAPVRKWFRGSGIVPEEYGNFAL